MPGDGLVEYFFPGDKLTYTASAAITKGQIVEISGNRTVAPAPAGSFKAAGVALEDAAVNDVVVVASTGVWPVTAGAVVATGDVLVVAGAAGRVGPAGVAPDPRAVVGRALEAIASGSAGRVKVSGPF